MSDERAKAEAEAKANAEGESSAGINQAGDESLSLDPLLPSSVPIVGDDEAPQSSGDGLPNPVKVRVPMFLFKENNVNYLLLQGYEPGVSDTYIKLSVGSDNKITFEIVTDIVLTKDKLNTVKSVSQHIEVSKLQNSDELISSLEGIIGTDPEYKKVCQEMLSQQQFDSDKKTLADRAQGLINDLAEIKAKSLKTPKEKEVKRLEHDLAKFMEQVSQLKFPSSIPVDKLGQLQDRLGDLQVHFAPRKYYLYEGGFVVEEIDPGEGREKYSHPVGKWKISNGKIKIVDLTSSEQAQYRQLLDVRREELSNIEFDPKNLPQVNDSITDLSRPIKGKYYLQNDGAVFFVASNQDDAEALYVGEAHVYENRLVIDSSLGLRPAVNFSIDDCAELKSGESEFGLAHFDCSDEELKRISEKIPPKFIYSGKPHLFPGNIVALMYEDGRGQVLGRWERVRDIDTVRIEEAGVVAPKTKVDKIRLIEIDEAEKEALENLLTRKAFKEKAIPFDLKLSSESDSTIDLRDPKNREIKKRLDSSNDLALPGYYRFRADGLIEFCPEEGAPKPPGFFSSLFGKKKPKYGDYAFTPVGTWEFDDENNIVVSYSLTNEAYEKSYLSEEMGYYHLLVEDRQMRNLGHQFTEDDFDPTELERAKEDFDKYSPVVEASVREKHLREDARTWKTALERQDYSVSSSYYSGHEDRDIIRTPSNNEFWHDKKLDTVGIPPNAFFKNSNIVDDYVKLLSRMCKPKFVDERDPEVKLVIRFSERMQPFKEDIIDAIKKAYPGVECVEAKDREEFKRMLSSEAPSSKRNPEPSPSEEPASKLPRIVRGRS